SPETCVLSPSASPRVLPSSPPRRSSDLAAACAALAATRQGSAATTVPVDEPRPARGGRALVARILWRRHAGRIADRAPSYLVARSEERRVGKECRSGGSRRNASKMNKRA